MPYPRNIYLDEYAEGRLKSFLDDELFKHYAERSGWLSDLEKYQHAYWAEPVNEELTFPFSGASRIVIPLDAIAVEAIHARTMTTMFGIPQFISAKAISPEWQNADAPFERYMDHELLHKMKAYKVFDNITLECEKYGTACGKAGYERIVKYAVREVGGREEEFPVVIKEGATLDAVPISRFLMPWSSLNPQYAQWCGEEHSHTPYEVRQMEEGGLFYEGTFDKLSGWVNTLNQGVSNNDFEKSQADLEKKVPAWPDRINWVEAWLAFNVDGNDKKRQHEIVVHYHKESQTLMSIRYNWHTDLRRPYRIGVYFPVEHRWSGIGICKQNDQFQEEITAMHRLQLDNAALANMRMIKVSRMSNYGPQEPIFPGKMWILDDMTHIDTMQLSEVYPSSYNSEQSTLMFSQMRTSVNESTLGMPQAGTPGTATSDLARIQEGSKKFGYTYKNEKELVDELVIDVACNLQQFGPRTVEYPDFMEGGDEVTRLLNLPERFIRDGLALEIRSAGQMENKLVDRQNLIQVTQLYQQYAQQRIELAQMLSQIPEVGPQIAIAAMMAAFNGSTEIMRQILETFDLRNIQRILTGIGVDNGQLNAGGNGIITQAGAAPGVGLPSQVPTQQAGNSLPQLS